MARIIINSDDFALNKEVNSAIVRSFQKNLITSTTSLVNFRDGLKDAILHVNSGNIPVSSIGIHLNLTEGHPILEETLKCELICSGNKFHGNVRKKPIFRLNSYERKIIFNELNAQFEVFKNNFGFSPSHIDGHHHIHTEWAIMEIVIQIAKKHSINKIRLSRNIGQDISYVKKLYKILLNGKLKLSGINTTDYFGDFNDLNTFQIPNNATVEVMVHAILDKNEEIVDLDNTLLSSKIESFKKTGFHDYLNYSII